MSDNRHVVYIASLLASRLCHDLVNPVGALSTGLDVFMDETDPEMRDLSLKLIQQSTRKTVAILTFARLAFGSSGNWEGDLDMGDVASKSRDYFEHVKAELKWELPPEPLPKAQARALMNMLLLAERLAPRKGSIVRVHKADDGMFMITATGPKVKFSNEVKASLSGDMADLQAKETPGYLAYLLAEANGDQLTFEAVSEQEIIFGLRPGA